MSCSHISDFTPAHNLKRNWTNCLITRTYCVLFSWLYVGAMRGQSCKQECYCQISEILNIAFYHLCVLYNFICGYCCFSQVFSLSLGLMRTVIASLLFRCFCLDSVFVPNSSSVHYAICSTCCLEEYFVQPKNKAVFRVSFYFSATAPLFHSFRCFLAFFCRYIHRLRNVSSPGERCKQCNL